MLEACASGDSFERKENCGMNMDEIIDECKTFFLGGNKTTSHLLTWTVFLLSTNQEWREKLREEVGRECGEEVHDADMLSKLKLVCSQTVWSLCPTYKEKQAKGMDLGGIKIPKDTMLAIPIMMIHRDKELWGDPSRFVNGIAKAAKHPSALLPFLIGPRSCIGKNFAMLEAKTVLAMLLQRFSFSISPKY
ncbi:Cytochrome P450 734A6, partial [Ananas comosus]